MASKTVILLDHREGLLCKTDQVVDIDEHKATKSKWTVLMESAVEYTRVLLDVCSATHPVSRELVIECNLSCWYFVSILTGY